VIGVGGLMGTFLMKHKTHGELFGEFFGERIFWVLLNLKRMVIELNWTLDR